MLRMDAFLVARRLPLRPMTGLTWPGHKVLTIARRGIPHTIDRLLYLWAATMGVERGLSFTFNLSEISALFGFGWRPYRTAERLSRIAGTTLEGSYRGAGVQQFTTFEEIELAGENGFIKLGTLFTSRECRPLDLRVARKLIGDTRCLTALDLYLWQIETAWRRRDELPLKVPVFGPGGVMEALPGRVTSKRKARQSLRERLHRIKEAWPQCPHHLTSTANEFVLTETS